CGDAEYCVDKLPLRYGIALPDPTDLTLADCMHRLVALNGSTRALDRSEPQARRDPLLDESMVLLDDVVQIRCGSATTAATQLTGLLQIGDRAGVGGCPSTLITLGRCATRYSDAQEQLRHNQITLRRQHKLDRRTGRVHGAVEIRPTATLN